MAGSWKSKLDGAFRVLGGGSSPGQRSNFNTTVDKIFSDINNFEDDQDYTQALVSLKTRASQFNTLVSAIFFQEKLETYDSRYGSYNSPPLDSQDFRNRESEERAIAEAAARRAAYEEAVQLEKGSGKKAAGDSKKAEGKDKDKDKEKKEGGAAPEPKPKKETAAEKKEREEREAKAAEEAKKKEAERLQQIASAAASVSFDLDSDQCKISRLMFPLTTYYLGLAHPDGDLFVNRQTLFIQNPSQNPDNVNLTKNSEQDMNLYYMPNHFYSALIPTVEMFKVYREPRKSQADPIGKITDVIPIIFPSSAGAIQSTTGDPLASSLQIEQESIGIKSVSWHYDGTDRYTSEKLVTAQVVLFMESFDSLFKLRSANGKNFKYSDLLIRTGCYADSTPAPASPGTAAAATPYDGDGRQKYLSECYEMVLNAGYHISDRALKEIGVSHLVTQKNIKKLRVSLYLTLNDHKFNFNKNGSVEVTINYRGRLEGTLRSPSADITIANQGTLPAEIVTSLEGLGAENSGLTPEQRNRLLPSTRSAGAPSTGQDAGQQAASTTTTTTRTVNPNTNIRDTYGQLEGIRDELRRSGTNMTADQSSAAAKIDGLLSQLDKEVVLQFFNRVNALMVERKAIFELNVDKLEALKTYISKPSPEALTACVNEMSAQIGATVAANGSGTAQSTGGIQASTQTPPTQPAAPNQNTSSSSPEAPSGESSPEGTGTTGQAPAEEPMVKIIPYVFFGDFLDALVSVMNGDDNPQQQGKIFEGIKVILPNVNLPSYGAGMQNGSFPLVPMTMAAAPIAFETLTAFTSAKIQTGQKSFTFLALMRDMVNSLIPEALGLQCKETKYMPSLRGNFYQFTSYENTDISSVGTGQTGATVTVTNGVDLQSLIMNFKDEYDYSDYIRTQSLGVTEILLPYMENTTHLHQSSGIEAQDRARGIPHFTFGAHDGIFISAQLDKVDQPYNVEARFEDTKGAYLSQFTNLYNATIDMFGNNLIYLGGYVYCDFYALSTNLGKPNDGRSLSYFMGLGGLHWITDIRSTMSPGSYKTTIQARFVSRGEKQATSSDTGTIASADPGTTVVNPGPDMIPV